VSRFWVGGAGVSEKNAVALFAVFFSVPVVSVCQRVSLSLVA